MVYAGTEEGEESGEHQIQWPLYQDIDFCLQKCG